MDLTGGRLLQTRPLAAVSAILAGGLLLGAWAYQDWASVLDLSNTLVAFFLAAAILVAERYPIHIRYHTKIVMTSVPLYLTAALLPPPLAALAACTTVLLAAFLQRKQYGYLTSDLLLSGTRIVPGILLASWIAHGFQGEDSVQQGVALIGAALALYAADMVTSAIQIAPMCGEPVGRVLRENVRESFVVEGLQYLFGVLGALAALQALWALALLALPVVIAQRAFKNTRELRESTRAMLERIAETVDLRDFYTGGHSKRVARYCECILNELHIRGAEADLILAVAPLHDIGKMGISDAILNKPGPLTEAEYAEMKTHAEKGAEMLGSYPDFARGVSIVRHHHEWWNGKGYPAGLCNYDIPFGARLLAVADAFDALTSDRPYRRGISASEAAAVLRQEAGKQWDPALVEAFLNSQGISATSELAPAFAPAA